MVRSEESTITHEDNNNVVQQVIDISDTADSGSSELPGADDLVWYYMDGLERMCGPFSMTQLRVWGRRGFFDESFGVWRTGQSRRDAVLLSDISRRYRCIELSAHLEVMRLPR